MSKVSPNSSLPGDGDGSSPNASVQNRWTTVYLPAAGSISALAFSTNVMNPKLFRNCFAPYQLLVANSLWFNAHVGSGLYLYTRRHIVPAPGPQRIMFSVVGAVIFNFGTVLFWATTKTLLPRSDFLRTVFGLVSGVAFLAAGRRYLQYVDERA